ncbi:MAG TPA: LLM class flavin-dependent oxidoreductase [Chloroflexota bacterium]
MDTSAVPAQPFRLGVFMPVGNNGWIISKTSPQYMPTYQLNRDVALLAEEIGFDYVFSMAKWSGYGGEVRYWDYSIESFTLMTALAAVTKRLQLVASVAPILIHPAIMAKIAVTLDDVSGGRLAINIVSSDHEFIRMGLYPEDFESYRHAYIDEWLRVMKLLWTGEPVDFWGDWFTLTGYASNPTPVQKPWPAIIYATSSEAGFKFVAEHCDEAFVRADEQRNLASKTLKQFAADHGRTIKTQAAVCLVQGESDEDAQRTVDYYRQGAALESIANVYDPTYEGDRAARGKDILDQRFPRPLFYHSFPLIGGPERIADFIEDMAKNGHFDGILFSFPDYLEGLAKFNRYVSPVLKDRGLRI